MKKTPIYSILLVVFIAIIFFAVGFFFGYKTKVNNGSTDTATTATSSPANSASSISSTASTTLTNTTTDVFWIKVGTNPVCPDTHPIKGKFDSSTAKFYYTTDNKNYDRVRPDICFTTENFAKDTAGFVKKF